MTEFLFVHRQLDQLLVLLHQYLRTGAGEVLSKYWQVDTCIPNAFSRLEEAATLIRSGGDWQKRKRFEDNYPSPSEAGKKFLAYQRQFPIQCHRPPDLTGLHVTLQVEAFARFLDVHEPPAQYNTLALDLMMSMSGFFATESGRQQEFMAILRSYNVFPNCTYEDCARLRSSIPDVRVVNTAGTALAILEFRNEVCNISSEPYGHSIACFIHSQTKHHRHRSPMLLITCTGCILQVYGALWNRGDLCVDPLSTVSLLHVPKDPFTSAQEVARVFAAVTAFANATHMASEKAFGPYFIKFGKHTLQYTKQFTNQPFLFHAVLKDDKGTSSTVVVKFALQYGIDVHKFLATKNQAPKVIHYQKLAGNWCVVVM